MVSASLTLVIPFYTTTPPLFPYIWYPRRRRFFPLRDTEILLWYLCCRGLCIATTAQHFCFEFWHGKYTPMESVSNTLDYFFLLLWELNPEEIWHICLDIFALIHLLQNSINMSICLFYKVLISSKGKCFGTITQIHVTDVLSKMSMHISC